MSARLPFHEWCIVILFSLILFTMVALGWTRPQNELLPTNTSKAALVNVSIEGAVLKPGNYELPSTATIKHLLALAQPLESADLSEIRERRRLYDKQTVQVPHGKMMTIYLNGAVKEVGAVSIRKGTRLSEFVAKLEVLPEADISLLQKRKRFLKEGEHLHVPTKKLLKARKTTKKSTSKLV